MKKLILLAALLAAVCNVEAKDNYARFRKSKKIANDNKEVFQDGRALQISIKENSVVLLSIETTELEGKDQSFTSLISVSVAEGVEELFDPEKISFEVAYGEQIRNCVVANPEQSKILEERKLSKKKRWAKIANGLVSQNGTAAALNQMNITNDYNFQLQNLKASAREFVQITTLNDNCPEVGGKVIFSPTNKRTLKGH